MVHRIQNPLEEAAAHWLPWDWKDGGGSNLLALAQWGMFEGGVWGDSNVERVKDALVKLYACDPTAATDWIASGGRQDEVSFQADDLVNANSPEHAAALVIEAIEGHLVEERPLPPRAR